LRGIRSGARPGWLDHFIFNEYYKTEEEFCSHWLTPCEEYRAVVAAGCIADR